MPDSKKQGSVCGLTLVEVLIASAISTVTIGLMLGIYMANSDFWEIKSTQADLQAQARIALERMSSELKAATRTSTQNPSPNLDIPSHPNNKDINFCLPADNDGNGLITDAAGNIEWDTNSVIKYQYIPGQKELRRLVNGNIKILAADVSEVEFIDASIDSQLALTELRINLTLSADTSRKRAITTTLSSTIQLRN